MRTIKETQYTLEDVQINVKLKISALWISVMFCYVYGDYIQIFVPGILTEALQVPVDKAGIQWEYFAVALLMSIPSVMIFSTLVLRAKLNRWLNIAISTFFVVLLVVLNVETTWGFYLYLTVLEVALSIAIIWYAVTWPKS